MKKRIILGAVVLAMVSVNDSVASDGGWFGKATDFMNSDIGQRAIGTLSGSGTASSASPSLAALSNTDIVAGLKQALEVGTTTVVGQLGQADGFNLDPKIRIPLPGQLARVDQALSAIGMNGLTDDLEVRLNRAAEAATPRAKELFISAIQNMSIDDAKGILTGPNDAATQYLRRAMGGELAKDMSPIVRQTLSQAGALQAYDQVIGQYQQIPFVPDVKANLNDYVVDKALDGIFTYVAAEEAAIRTNPAERSSEILQKVFGAVR